MQFSEKMIQEAMMLHSCGRLSLQKHFGLSQKKSRQQAKILRDRFAQNDKSINENKVEFSERHESAELSGQAATLDELLEKAKVDLDVWEVDTYEIKDNSWDVTMKNQEKDLDFVDGTINGSVVEVAGGITKTNRQFYIKARLKRRTDFTATQKFKQQMIDEIKNYAPKVKITERKLPKSGNPRHCYYHKICQIK